GGSQILPHRARAVVANPSVLPSEVQFCDALVTSATLIFEKTLPRRQHDVRISFAGPISSPTGRQSVSLSALRRGRKWTPFTGPGSRVAAHATTLGEFFTIKRGLATGANAFFILKRPAARAGHPRGVSQAGTARPGMA